MKRIPPGDCSPRAAFELWLIIAFSVDFILSTGTAAVNVAGMELPRMLAIDRNIGAEMAWAIPKHCKIELNQAGNTLVDESASIADHYSATEILSNWRACHNYPINTFKATLHTKLKSFDGDTIIGQRLKRTPSIIDKLRRYPSMRLSQMQDIGGLRAVLSNVSQVNRLQASYKTKRFKHELVNEKDYIETPKPSGYRSVHLVFKYISDHEHSRIYNGLSVELQIRTKLQHAWATAVETMGTFLGQALKASRGEQEWLRFFEATGAAFAILENCPSVPGYENMDKKDIFCKVAEIEQTLHAVHMLNGFSAILNSSMVAQGSRTYHLITLDSEKKQVSVAAYPLAQQDKALRDYAAAEVDAKATGGRVDVVLVSAGPLNLLRRAYPNYFLDTHDFVQRIEDIIKTSVKP